MSQTKKIIPKEPTRENFVSFGQVLTDTKDGYESLFSRPDAPGWQAAINRAVERETRVLHRHSDTWECFVPMDPGVYLLAATPDNPEEVNCFLLDKAVVVAPQVWHTLLAPLSPGRVFICENSKVSGEVRELDWSLSVVG